MRKSRLWSVEQPLRFRDAGAKPQHVTATPSAGDASKRQQPGLACMDRHGRQRGRLAERYTLWRMWIGRKATLPKGKKSERPSLLERRHTRNECERTKNSRSIATCTARHSECATTVPLAATTFRRDISCNSCGLNRNGRRFEPLDHGFSRPRGLWHRQCQSQQQHRD